MIESEKEGGKERGREREGKERERERKNRDEIYRGSEKER
jgi:hypothetical protein